MERETAARKEKRLSVRQVVSFVVSVIVSAVLVFMGLSWGLDYRPTDVQMYQILPDVVCPGQETELHTVFEVKKPRLGSVRTFSVDSTWVKEGGPDRIGLPETPFPFRGEPFNGRYGHHDNISPVKRFAPNDPGVWYLETTLTTHGTQALHLASHTVQGLRSNPVTVRRFNDPICQSTASR